MAHYRITPALIMCATALALPSAVQSYEAGDWLLKVGSAAVNPQSPSDDIV